MRWTLQNSEIRAARGHVPTEFLDGFRRTGDMLTLGGQVPISYPNLVPHPITAAQRLSEARDVR
ncbi:hypothetical protein GCM10027184_74620 [Saccharothrix stipae]